MRQVNPWLFRLAAVFTILFVAAFSAASLSPTQAWRRIINHGTDDDIGGISATDASGYTYVFYLDETASGVIAHVVKIGPAKNIVWDSTQSLPYFVSGVPKGIAISPAVSGLQHIYVAAEMDNNTIVYMNEWNSDGTSAGNNTNEGSSVTGFSIYFVGIHAATNGNGYFALRRAPLNATSYELSTFIFNSGGFDIGTKDIPTMNPTGAVFSETLNKWIVAGNDNAAATPNSARFSYVDPSTGAESNIVQSAGSQNGAAYVKQSFTIGLLGGDTYSVAHNTVSYNGTGSPAQTYKIEFHGPSGVLTWSLPASGSYPGMVSQITDDSSYSDLYAVGHIGTTDTRSFVDQFDQDLGAVKFHHTSQPVDVLFPSNGGYFSSWYYAPSNTVYMEHYDGTSNSYDWGTTYKGTGSSPNSFSGASFFQNYFFWVLNISNTSTGYDILVDRYVTGICFQNITSAGTVQAGHTIDVTLHLNAPATSNVVIGLNSRSNYLLMPNGTRAQNFTVTAGNSSVVATLHVPAGSPASTASLLGIQNGIYRYSAVSITP